MKRLLPLLLALIAIAAPASAAWKMNPHTGKLDYYESGSIAPCTFSADNTLMCPGFGSTAADNTRMGEETNTGDIPPSLFAAGVRWYNSTAKLWKFRTYDNGATAEFFTSEGANTGNFLTTGTLGGAVRILDNVSVPTAAQSYGSLNLVNANITVLLPTAAAGMSTCVQDSGTAHDIIVDVQAGDTITLVGVEGAAGVGVTNASGSSTGDFLCVISQAANKWTVMGKQGTWASQ